MKASEMIGLKVQVLEGTNRLFDNKIGVVSSADDRTVLPVHVTFQDMKGEVDFAVKELRVVE